MVAVEEEEEEVVVVTDSRNFNYQDETHMSSNRKKNSYQPKSPALKVKRIKREGC